MNREFHVRLLKLKRYYIVIFIVVSSVIAASLTWNIFNEVNHHKNAALEHARNSFIKDLMFRKWVASHGGVYVVPTQRTPPNPYLAHLPNRDLVTTDGMKLTLMNPAYTLRQLMNEYEGMYGAKGHITSLKLLNPNNKPSAWETKALKIFDEGKKIEFYEYVERENKEYIYYMKGLVTQESCLKCHAHQGYRVGDVRGGVSITIPMTKYNNDLNEVLIKILFFYFLFYIMALFGLFYTYRTLRLSVIEQERLYEQNHKKEELMLAQSRSAAMGEMISMIAHQWRQPIAIIAMWTNNIKVDIDMEQIDNDHLKTYSDNILTQTQHLSKTIDDFRNFFRPDKQRERVLLKDILNECLAVMGKSLENDNIEVEQNYHNETYLEIYSRELMQVYINIIKNAKEALLEHKIKDAKIVLEIYENEKSIVTTISDNALGVNNAIIDKIFDPYFTTKGVKSGTGLGLYMSKIIVEKHLFGTLDIKNIENGVCFSISIPKNTE